MDILKEFEKMMSEQTDMALATIGEDGNPNVRIVNFYFESKSRLVYFSTFKSNDKVREIKQNDQVAFTTVPKNENEHVKAKGTVMKSKKTIFDMADYFCKKIPGYKETIEYGGSSLLLYEIHFDQVNVTLDLSNSQIITL